MDECRRKAELFQYLTKSRILFFDGIGEIRILSIFQCNFKLGYAVVIVQKGIFSQTNSKPYLLLTPYCPTYGVFLFPPTMLGMGVFYSCRVCLFYMFQYCVRT